MKKDILIDSENLYVRGLIKVINEFLIEDALGCVATGQRLQKNIGHLQAVFMDERKRMMLGDKQPLFNALRYEDYNLVFTDRDIAGLIHHD